MQYGEGVDPFNSFSGDCSDCDAFDSAGCSVSYLESRAAEMSVTCWPTTIQISRLPTSSTSSRKSSPIRAEAETASILESIAPFVECLADLGATVSISRTVDKDGYAEYDIGNL